LNQLIGEKKMNSVLLITGAAGGLGSAFARTAARRGYDLVLTDKDEKGEAFARQLAAKYSCEVHYVPCDLTSDGDRTRLFETFAAHEWKFWGVINVAGLDFEGAYASLQRGQAMTVLKVNLLANMDVTHAVLQLRDPQQKFRVINVCSMAGFYPMPFKATYAATKRFLLDFSLALREEIRDYGSVMALCPGGMPTTEECMRAIFAQGFWGWATTVDPQQVAEATLKRALRGQALYIPGWANRLLWMISMPVPARWKAHFVAARWRKAQAATAASCLSLGEDAPLPAAHSAG
jgi:short-subunit dehydrogenase